MTSTRNSKKGFQKLENQELAEFTSLGNGTIESGSENDLLDLTTVEEGELRGRWNGCCCWCSCLYFGVLTLLFLLLGVYCGYLTFNLWQMTDSTTSTHNDLDKRLASMETGMKSYKIEMAHKYSALQEGIWTLEQALNRTQSSLENFRESSEKSLKEMGSKVEDLSKRLKVAESRPQEMLIKQVDLINKDMGVLNTSMRKLNTSLADINMVKSQLAELGSVNSRYDDDLRQIKTSMADVRQANGEMKESVDAAVDAAASFKTRLDSIDSTLSTSHDQVQQTTDLLSAQVASVQLSLMSLNESVRHDVEELESNVTSANISLEKLAGGLTLLMDQVVEIRNQSPDSSIKTLDHTPTAPPPTLSPLTDNNSANNSKNTDNTVGDSTEPVEPVDEPATPTPQSTESQSTSATEDSVPVSEEKNTEATVAVSNDDRPLNLTEQDIEANKLGLEAEINRTESAITLLQTLADNFISLDLNDNDGLDLEEFSHEIPKPYIFTLLDTNQDKSITYQELLWSVDNLKLKMNQLRRDMKGLQSLADGLEEDATTEAPVEEGNYDPVLQKKLKELFQYIMESH